MFISLSAFQLQLNSNRVVAILDFANMAAPGGHSSWRPSKIEKVWFRQHKHRPNMVLLEESEPNTIYDVLTSPTNIHGIHCVAQEYLMQKHKLRSAINIPSITFLLLLN